MNTKYYVEFWLVEDTAIDPPYRIQSRNFKTKAQAIKWFKTNFDYVNMKASLMRIEEVNEYEGDIEFEAELN